MSGAAGSVGKLAAWREVFTGSFRLGDLPIFGTSESQERTDDPPGCLARVPMPGGRQALVQRTVLGTGPATQGLVVVTSSRPPTAEDPMEGSARGIVTGLGFLDIPGTCP